MSVATAAQISQPKKAPAGGPPWLMNAGLSLMGGGLAALAFPNPWHPQMSWPAGGLAFVCLLPLLAVEEKRGWRASWPWGFLFGLAYFGINLFWIAQMPALEWMAPLAWLILIAYLAVFPMLFFMGYQALGRRGVPDWFAIPLLWTSLEYLRNYSLSGFPWASLGYAHAHHPWMMSMAPVAGVWGMSLVTVMVNAVAWALIRRYLLRQPLPHAGSFFVLRAAILALLAGVLLAGALHEHQALEKDPGGAPVKVAGIQGNISQNQSWDRAYQSRVLDIYGASLREAVGHGARLVVWPETAFPGIFNIDRRLAEEVQSWSKSWNVSQLVGADEVEYSPKESAYQYYNSLIYINALGRVEGRTAKVHLVPFGEYVPFKHSLLYFVDKLVRRYGGAGFTPGKARHLLPWEVEGRSIPVGSLICFETIFPQYAAHLTSRGSQLLAMVTYDTWFGRTAAPAQHALYSAFRAAENGRYLIRVGATGISALFDPRGQLLASVPLDQAGLLEGEIRPRTHLTLYTRMGDWLPLLCMLLVAIDLLAGFIRRDTLPPTGASAENRQAG